MLRKSLSFFVIALSIWFSGCAAITNPVANGVPARLVPEEILEPSKEETEQIPLSWLRRSRDKSSHILAPDDILAVYIEGILPERAQNLPIHFPDSATLPPTTGVPIPVRQDGTVSLPLVPPVKVGGLSVADAEKKIVLSYVKVKKILKEDDNRVLVGLARPRYTRILVIREDNPNSRAYVNPNAFATFRSVPLVDRRERGSGRILSLPSIEADLLTALAETGGPPGPTAKTEIFVFRGFNAMGNDNVMPDWNSLTENTDENTNDGTQTIRIPMFLPRGAKKPFTEKDIRLQNDDIVYIAARKTDVYYTGGLLPAREVSLPRDYDLRVLEAVLRIGGSVANGGRFTNNFTGGILSNGLGTPSPSLLTVIRKTPGNGHVNIRVDLNKALRDPRENIVIAEGDILLLQETPSEAISRYFTQVLRLNGAANIFSTGSATAAATGQLP